MFVAVIAATPEGRIAKYKLFGTEVDADAHVVALSAAFPGAFTIEKPSFIDRNWLVDMADGTITEDVPPESVPDNISKLQLVRAMRISGIWGTVKSAMKQSPSDTKEDWELAHIILRTDPLMSSFVADINLTEAEVDDLFRVGATL